MKKFLLIFCISMLLFGCDNTTINNYNKISAQHQEVTKQAFDVLSEGIDLFNKQDYTNSILQADKCTTLYTQARDLSNQAKNLAQKIKNKSWLVDFKNYAIQTEEIRLEQCSLLKNAGNYTIEKEYTKAQEAINQISELNIKFNKLQATMDDIKNQHPESFK